jgi:hypothetical protein
MARKLMFGHNYQIRFRVADDSCLQVLAESAGYDSVPVFVRDVVVKEFLAGIEPIAKDIMLREVYKMLNTIYGPPTEE